MNHAEASRWARPRLRQLRASTAGKTDSKILSTAAAGDAETMNVHELVAPPIALSNWVALRLPNYAGPRRRNRRSLHMKFWQSVNPELRAFAESHLRAGDPSGRLGSVVAPFAF